ncbi:hypothetical protein HMPREF1315_1152 [Bifidobacterium longum subsp. longum 2-2B]|uniref:Uncharacterized protein n=1 Tax=Bifidobacterium longum subsp. longum 2-2B TaxID=1161745 RepID=A0AAV3FNH0_BIFLL|nr:hypothetical protein HMPREF1315_1152 [Bifidobacterium longum subsp. longum 2-2B]
MSVHPLPSNFPAMAPPTPFQGMAGLPTAGITGGSHRMIRQPPTSLTGDTPSHGAQRLQKTKTLGAEEIEDSEAVRMHGNTASWEYGREPKISVLRSEGNNRGEKGMQDGVSNVQVRP